MRQETPRRLWERAPSIAISGVPARTKPGHFARVPLAARIPRTLAGVIPGLDRRAEDLAQLEGERVVALDLEAPGQEEQVRVLAPGQHAEEVPGREPQPHGRRGRCAGCDLEAPIRDVHAEPASAGSAELEDALHPQLAAGLRIEALAEPVGRLVEAGGSSRLHGPSLGLD